MDTAAVKGEVLTSLAVGTQAAVVVVGEVAHMVMVDQSKGGADVVTGEHSWAQLT